ncbi:glycosyl hydrolase 115 family protein [Flavitalea flava]
MKKAAFIFMLNLAAFSIYAQVPAHAFPIVYPAASPTGIYVDSNDYWLVQKAAGLLQQDIERVTGCRPVIIHTVPQTAENLIIVGSLDSCRLVRGLTSRSTLLADSLKDKWEAWSIETIDHPVKGITRALVIAGSDRRGTAYGVFELSRKIGISPWYWWADVPVPQKKELYLKQAAGVWSHPTVKYRGFFINDEAPALSGWAHKKFGGLNHFFYERVFELLLRMKANFLWPAMWGNAFNDDDTLNPVMADKYGIVMGTSHHEPMLRAQQEWKRYGSGQWNYAGNEDTLRAFWKKGIEHMGSHESIVTVGMRGDGDMPMTEGSNIALLERIVHDQRGIIQSVTGKTPAAIPQAWALYKEVQQYYDNGMRVPDDITLLLCDDNWGNVRKLPAMGEKSRAGGYGMYYHFDYVGDPRNYKWLNTNQIERVWEQMHLSWQYGVDRIWIVNVGDIKPMEFPIEFFLDYAWDPARWPAEKLPEYGRQWAARQFGPEHAPAIAEILAKYTRYNARRKPELLSPETYSLVNYREWETVAADYQALASQADSINQLLPVSSRDAFYQLILHPVKACSNLNELYYTVAKNRLYAGQGRSSTNQMAERAKELYTKDSILSRYYNQEMAGGKWDHMMDQTHIGYTYWQQPPVNSMPEVKTIDTTSVSGSSWGVSLEGSESWWPGSDSNVKSNVNAVAALPSFDPYGPAAHYMEVFNRTQHPFKYSIKSDAAWLRISPSTNTTQKDEIDLQDRLWVNIDWGKVPAGNQYGMITVSGPDGKQVKIKVPLPNPLIPKKNEAKGFIETTGFISIEAEHYSRAVESKIKPENTVYRNAVKQAGGNETAVKWQRIPGLGRTLSGMTTMPVTIGLQTKLPGGSSPHLEYDVYLFDTGTVNVQAFFSPTLDFSTNGLRYGISFDEETPKILDLHVNPSTKPWEISVANNIFTITSRHRLTTPGKHVLKFWMVDPGVVLQKLVIDAGGVKPSYLGPPETFHRN